MWYARECYLGFRLRGQPKEHSFFGPGPWFGMAQISNQPCVAHLGAQAPRSGSVRQALVVVDQEVEKKAQTCKQNTGGASQRPRALLAWAQEAKTATLKNRCEIHQPCTTRSKPMTPPGEQVWSGQSPILLTCVFPPLPK